MVLTLDETRRAGAGRSRAGDARKERAPHGGAGGTALTVLVVAIQEFNSQQIAGVLPKSWPLFDLRKKFSEPIADLGFILLQDSSDSLIIRFSRSMAPRRFHLAPKFGKQTVRR